jgi:5-bromo-4-chloroindolyl phosphate hydrolysis protein
VIAIFAGVTVCLVTKQKFSNNLKRKVVDDIIIRPSKILHSELKNYDIENITSRDVLIIKINIHNAR